MKRLLAQCERAVRRLNELPDDGSNLVIGLFVVVGIVIAAAPPRIADTAMYAAVAVFALIFAVLIGGGALEVIVKIGRRYRRLAVSRVQRADRTSQVGFHARGVPAGVSGEDLERFESGGFSTVLRCSHERDGSPVAPHRC